jgi:hypothetical protein
MYVCSTIMHVLQRLQDKMSDIYICDCIIGYDGGCIFIFIDNIIFDI